MSNGAHLLPPEIAAAAAAIANARGGRRGAPAFTNVLDLLPEAIFGSVVEDARAALAAIRALKESPPRPRARGDLRASDADALRLDLGASTLVVIARNPAGRATAVFSAIAGDALVLSHEGGAQTLLAAIADVMRGRADEPPPSPTATEPAP